MKAVRGCENCEGVLLPTDSGAVCEKGCGRIQPALDRNQRRALASYLIRRPLPKAEPSGRKVAIRERASPVHAWRIEGRHGLYRRHASLKTAAEGHVVAVRGGRRIVLRKIEEEEVVESG